MAHGIITPDEAVEVVRKAVALCPDITVVGVAGPGDTLATPYALETFRKIKKEFPNIIKCMSTNGLRLLDRAEEIIEVGIDTLTVTVNAVDPDIQAQICKGIVWRGKRYTGREGAEILIENQLSGIEKVAKAGVTVKVNTVLIPEINADHVPEVAKAVSGRGAQMYNLTPVPQHELDWCSAPSCSLIDGTGSRWSSTSRCSGTASGAGPMRREFPADRMCRRSSIFGRCSWRTRSPTAKASCLTGRLAAGKASRPALAGWVYIEFDVFYAERW